MKTILKESKVPGVICSPGTDGEIVTHHALFDLTEAQCGDYKFWFGIASVAILVSEDQPPVPPCNPATGGFRLELEDGRQGVAVLQTMQGEIDYCEIGFVGLTPLRSLQPPPSLN